MRKVIDVSFNQGNIDFNKVKASGVTGVIIRGGYRGYISGMLTKDMRFDEYMEGANKAGLTVGAYYVTQAINEEEAREEARYLVVLCKPYKITEKLAIDVEWAGNRQLGEEGRANSLSKDARTAVINAFADEIKKLGFEPMCYANRDWFTNKINASINCPAWVAHYYDEADINTKYELPGYDVCGWQYSSSLSIPGVSSARVDTNVFYYTAIAPTPTPEPQPTLLHKLGEEVEYTTIYASSDSTNALKPMYTKGTITKALEGARNPYLIGNGTGWVNDDCIVTASQPEPQPASLHKVGEVVEYNAIYTSSDSTEALKPYGNKGTITKVLEGKHNPYLINNGTGWINDDCIVSMVSGQKTPV